MAQETRQRDFLNEDSGGRGGSGAGGGNQEMPQDLLNFLNAAGPAERKVDKSMTSTKVYESLLEEDGEERQKKTTSRSTNTTHHAHGREPTKPGTTSTTSTRRRRR